MMMMFMILHAQYPRIYSVACTSWKVQSNSFFFGSNKIFSELLVAFRSCVNIIHCMSVLVQLDLYLPALCSCLSCPPPLPSPSFFPLSLCSQLLLWPWAETTSAGAWPTWWWSPKRGWSMWWYLGTSCPSSMMSDAFEAPMKVFFIFIFCIME